MTIEHFRFEVTPRVESVPVHMKYGDQKVKTGDAQILRLRMDIEVDGQKYRVEETHQQDYFESAYQHIIQHLSAALETAIKAGKTEEGEGDG